MLTALVPSVRSSGPGRGERDRTLFVIFSKPVGRLFLILFIIVCRCESMRVDERQ
jgi:hypothetical protein